MIESPVFTYYFILKLKLLKIRSTAKLNEKVSISSWLGQKKVNGNVDQSSMSELLGRKVSWFNLAYENHPWSLMRLKTFKI